MKKNTKLQVDVLTIFPEMIDGYASQSILGRAQKAGFLKVEAHDIRKYTTDKHNRVDDKPFGGGPGMILQVEPIYSAMKALKLVSGKWSVNSGKRLIGSESVMVKSKAKLKTRVILTSAKGKLFTQKDAQRLSKYDRLVFVCGRYEGVDERVAKHLVHEELSIGPYVLTGGELASLVMLDAVARLRPGVLGQEASLDEESWSNGENREYPQYSRPEDFMGLKVPPVLLSGDHKKIAEWRAGNSN
ncbi:MAG: tRNA (guanosine(37)-N1)-methyltransferase TrmD [Patescibacteria group bacterium]|nr:tRNA (guanosine(37)-N1)-methyltransferase TrmD [Patescibacteria group bacterium]